MKKIFTLLTVLAFATTTFAQVPKLVLVEHFTQASCGPCAGINPLIQPILDANHDKAVAIKYQTSWPGFDPMHNHNPLEANFRVAYYGVTGVPSTAFDGVGPGSPVNVITQDAIDAGASETSPFKINLTHKMSVGLDAITATMDIEAMGDYSGDLVAHIVVVEKKIAYDMPPGTNGETVFHEVMKKMLPNSNGTKLADNWKIGDKKTLEFTWQLKNVFNLNELDVVAFIQNNDTKEVVQAGNSEPSVEFKNDGLIVDAYPPSDFDNPGIVCGRELIPEIEILNAGSEPLTSLDIAYKVNGGGTKTYTWTGSLDYLEIGRVALPAIPFSGTFFNEMEFKTSNPNGVADENTGNDEFLHFFPSAPWTTPESTLEIATLGGPQFLTWKIFNSADEEVASGGPYSDANTTIKESLSLPKNDCYRLDVTNGVNSDNGRFKLLNDTDDNQGQISIKESGVTSLAFGTYNLSSVDKILNTNTLSIYPNPAANVTNIDFEMKEATRVEFVLTNSIGQKVWSATKDLTEGQHQEQIEVADFANGLYFLQLKTREGMISKQLLIER